MTAGIHVFFSHEIPRRIPGQICGRIKAGIPEGIIEENSEIPRGALAEIPWKSPA